MRKFSLRVSQMVTVEVTQAKTFASDLLRWETRGPGDTDNAMRRIARRYGIEYGQLWSLRYRAPKRIWADVLTAIKAAHDAEKQRQARALAHDTEITAKVAGPDSAAVCKARALLRQIEIEAAAIMDGGGE